MLTLSPFAAAQTPDGWELVWEETFDARDAAFEARWDVGTHTFDGNEAQFVAENVIVEDGLLRLRLTADPAGTRQYSGAELRTDNETGFFTYGRFEARMRAARGSGVISSLFTYRYDPWQEVDIEFKGRDTEAMQANIFFNRPGDNAPYEVPPFPSDAPLPYDAADAFHVYAFEWEPGVIRWFVDGEPVLESQDPEQVPYLPQQLMMNIWNTNLAWAGPLDPSALPAEAQYDWVRVYRRPDAPYVFDTFDDGDLRDVFVFSATGGGVTVRPAADAEGRPARALGVDLDPASTGGFAGVVMAGASGTVDVSAATALRFRLRADVEPGNLPLTLEVNLHEDLNGDGVYQGATEDEYQALVPVEGASDFVDVTIPIEAFTDDNSVFPGGNDGFDYARLLEVVVAVVGPSGPAYTLGFDEVAFLPPAVDVGEAPARRADVRLYPNPARRTATIALDLIRPGMVAVEVFDVLGRAVLSPAPFAAPAGTATVPLALGALRPGAYLVRVRTPDGATTRPLTIVR